eukprot:403370296
MYNKPQRNFTQNQQRQNYHHRHQQVDQSRVTHQYYRVVQPQSSQIVNEQPSQSSYHSQIQQNHFIFKQLFVRVEQQTLITQTHPFTQNKENIPPFDDDLKFCHSDLNLDSSSFNHQKNFQASIQDTPRTPLKDISKQLLSDLKEQKQQSHKTCLSCLLHCTSWVLDINDITDENAPIKKLTMRNPSIVYKHCQSQDQQDMLDDMIDRDFNSPSFNDEMILHRSPTVSQSQYLDTIGTLFPIRNKAKTLNSHIINFEFENQLKQEVFMLEFDLEALLKFEDLIKIFPLDFSINQKNFIFKINRISAMPMNQFQQFVRKNMFLIKAANLPKSFGFKLVVPQLLFSDRQKEQINLQNNINTEILVQTLKEKLQNSNIKQEQYITNYQMLLNALNISMDLNLMSLEMNETLTLDDVFNAFLESSAYGLKVKYMYNGLHVRVDYTPTLSCYFIHKKHEFSHTNDLNLDIDQLGQAFSPDKFNSPAYQQQMSQFKSTASTQQKIKDKIYIFNESQPPHLRACFTESVEELSEAKEIDLTLKISELSNDSYFAVHYQYLKQTVIPAGICDQTEAPSLNKNLYASFLVYYRINPKYDVFESPELKQKCQQWVKPQIIGMICSKAENYNFWASYQDENLDDLGLTPQALKFKQVEFDERNRIIQYQHQIDDFLRELGQSENDHYDLCYIKNKIFSHPFASGSHSGQGSSQISETSFVSQQTLGQSFDLGSESILNNASHLYLNQSTSTE